jgi:hypothetical protein
LRRSTFSATSWARRKASRPKRSTQTQFSPQCAWNYCKRNQWKLRLPPDAQQAQQVSKASCLSLYMLHILSLNCRNGLCTPSVLCMKRWNPWRLLLVRNKSRSTILYHFFTRQPLVLEVVQEFLDFTS